MGGCPREARQMHTKKKYAKFDFFLPFDVLPTYLEAGRPQLKHRWLAAFRKLFNSCLFFRFMCVHIALPTKLGHFVFPPHIIVKGDPPF